MTVKPLAAVAAVLLMAGCSRGANSLPPAPVPAPVPNKPPLSLTVSPESGTPGTTVTATLQLREPMPLARRNSDGSFAG